MNGDDPLFLVNTAQDGEADEPNWGMKGVLRDPHGKLFGINSSEGDEMLRLGGTVRGFFGILYYEPFDGADEELETGSEFSDVQIYLSGRVAGSNLSYYLMINESDGSMSLADAYVLWHNSDGSWGLRAGQFRDPESLEWLIPENQQIAAYRSLAHQLLNGFPGSGDDNRVQGLSFIFAPGDQMRGEVAVHDGFSTANTDLIDGIDSSHIGVSGRFEWLMQGLWQDYNSFSAYGLGDDGENGDSFMALGVGASMSWDDGDDRLGHLTADFMWKTGKLATFFAVHFNPLWDDGDDFMNYGGTAQASFLASDTFEPFVRGSAVFVDEDLVGAGEDTFFEITLGTSYFPLQAIRDRFRVIADVNFLPNGSPLELSGPNYPSTEEMIITFNLGGELRF